MIVHATRKPAQRLSDVSAEALPVEGSLGHWHADRLVLNRRQCVLFCHDQSRAALFAAGLRKPQFAALGDLFRPLFADTPVALGCPESQARRALLALGPCRVDTATDRSVLSSMRVIRQDLEAWLYRFPNVMMIDPIETSCRLTRRPASIHGAKFIWPNDLLLELVAGSLEVRAGTKMHEFWPVIGWRPLMYKDRAEGTGGVTAAQDGARQLRFRVAAGTERR